MKGRSETSSPSIGVRKSKAEPSGSALADLGEDEQQALWYHRQERYWAKVEADYEEWQRQFRLIPSWGWWLVAVFGLIALVVPNLWARAIGAGALLLALATVGQRSTHKNGYLDGYGRWAEGFANDEDQAINRGRSDSEDAATSLPAHTARANSPSGLRNAPHGVGGWLLLLCIGTAIGTPLAAGPNASYYYNIFTRAFGDSNLQLFAVTGIVLTVAVGVFGLVAGATLWRLQPSAPKIMKKFYIFLLASRAVIAISAFSLPTSASSDTLQAGASVMFAFTALSVAIWWTYLNKSKRVAATYPERRAMRMGTFSRA